MEQLKWGLKGIPGQIDYNEVTTTFMQTKVEYKMQQMPDMDCSKEVHQGWTDIDMSWIASLPLTELGGYMFVWDDDAKESPCIHVPMVACYCSEVMWFMEVGSLNSVLWLGKLLSGYTCTSLCEKEILFLG